MKMEIGELLIKGKKIDGDKFLKLLEAVVKNDDIQELVRKEQIVCSKCESQGTLETFHWSTEIEENGICEKCYLQNELKRIIKRMKVLIKKTEKVEKVE